MDSIIFRSNTTLMWPCQSGDYIIWCRCNGIFSSKGGQYSVNDVWQLKDGDSITLTNRRVDLPSWFELHPLEVSGSLVNWMMKKLDSGYEPKEIIKSSNIWRVMTGDRLVWVGKPRPGIESDNGILSIVTFNKNAVIIGEPFADYDGLLHFGGFDLKKQPKEDLLLCQIGYHAVSKLGTPRSITASYKWTIG